MVKGFLSKLSQLGKDIEDEFYNTSKEITLRLHKALSEGNKQKCRTLNTRHRILQQKYSQLTGIPIEPQDLTPFIDSVSEIENVWYAICPGSGGYDAVFVLGEEEEKIETN